MIEFLRNLKQQGKLYGLKAMLKICLSFINFALIIENLIIF